MKAKIYILNDSTQFNAALEHVKKEAAELGSYRFIPGEDAYKIGKNRNKYGLYKNEVDKQTKALIYEVGYSFPYENLYSVIDIDGELFNQVRVHRPMLCAFGLFVSIFFISYGYPDCKMDASFKSRFDIVEFPLNEQQ